jgi:hypothetical protein
MLFLTLPAARAQQDVAALAGEVTDTSGAQVAEASVKILDTRTGSEQETKTENDGSYRFLRLQPGPGYTLTVTKDGFQTASITNLYLAVATTRTQNVQLDLGAVSQTVEVTSEGSVTLNTTDSTIGNNFDLRAVASLPIEVNKRAPTAPVIPAAAAMVLSPAPVPIKITSPWMVSTPRTLQLASPSKPKPQFPSNPFRNSAPK